MISASSVSQTPSSNMTSAAERNQSCEDHQQLPCCQIQQIFVYPCLILSRCLAHLTLLSVLKHSSLSFCGICSPSFSLTAAVSPLISFADFFYTQLLNADEPWGSSLETFFYLYPSFRKNTSPGLTHSLYADVYQMSVSSQNFLLSSIDSYV